MTAPGGLVVTEPSALFYLLASADLSAVGDVVTTHVFSKNRLIQVDLTVTAVERLEVDYVEVSPPLERRVRGAKDLLRIILDGTPLGEGEADDDFELLGLRGNVVVFLDPEVRAPVQVSGKIKYAGKGNVRLQRVVLQ
jgi:hypothetical protein